MSEFIIYNSDQSSSRTPIEKNLNTYYNIYDQPLLDVVEDAKVAFSLRRLRSDYTGPAINVHNGTDYKDIYFKADGSLDTGAISRFCGSNDGTVAIWYDQSGNNNNATQGNAAVRPKIYDGTNGIVTDNNQKLTLDFDGDKFTMDSEVVINSNDPDKFLISVVAGGTPATTDERGEYFGFDSVNFLSYNEPEGKYKLRHTTTADGNINSEFTKPAGIDETKIANIVVYADNDVKNMRVNNSSDLVSSGTTAWASDSNGVIKINTVARAYARDYKGMYSEFIIWENHSDENLQEVQANINLYYSIY